MSPTRAVAGLHVGPAGKRADELIAINTVRRAGNRARRNATLRTGQCRRQQNERSTRYVSQLGLHVRCATGKRSSRPVVTYYKQGLPSSEARAQTVSPFRYRLTASTYTLSAQYLRNGANRLAIRSDFERPSTAFSGRGISAASDS